MDLPKDWDVDISSGSPSSFDNLVVGLLTHSRQLRNVGEENLRLEREPLRYARGDL